MAEQLGAADVVLNYNPEHPQERFLAAGVAGALKSASERLPMAVPWPAGHAPVAAPLPTVPAETDDLSQFAGYDAIVVTWTSAEAAALAALCTPGYPVSGWYEYRHNLDHYLPLVAGGESPFNDRKDPRYYHSLGLYFPCKIGNARVLLFKSGLHLDHDGPKTPVFELMQELAAMVRPKVFITTGTGGGVGAQVKLGDVIVASETRFHCTTKFKNEPWANASYQTSPLPAGALAAITPHLTGVNASRIPNARPAPTVWAATSDAIIVTTDNFAFDDTTDHYGLQGLGRVCDMGDAMVGKALEGTPGLTWYAIRNASDPQMPNPSKDIKAAGKEATAIYTEWGALTTAASVIASWAIIDARFNS